MNPITDNLPARLDGALADFAQSEGKIDYGDVAALGRAWNSLTDAERTRINGLADAWADGAEAAADQLAGAVKAAGKITPANPGFRPGDLVLYKNGTSYELGLVKRVTADGAFVYYSEGDTAAKTPFDCLHRLVNAFAVQSVTLGGKETPLENGHVPAGWSSERAAGT